jgi:hypothetical protein
LGIYNTFDWGDGTLYGDSSKVGYSAAPLTATAIGSTIYEEPVVIGYDGAGNPITSTKPFARPAVQLHWTNPTGSVFGFRIVRNQDGWSESEEDGVIILETFSPTIPADTNFTDQFNSVPLIEGAYAYYTVWVLLADYTWSVAAYTYCLIPTEHHVFSPDGSIYKTSERKFLDLIPKVYTSDMQSYVDEVSETSDLRSFLGGFSYTLDEIQTFADLLVPDISGKASNPNMVSLQAAQLGLPKEPTLSLQRKKALIRNGILLNKNRGSSAGVNFLTTSLTGFAASVTVSPNLLLNIQDSSFYKTIGSWQVSTNGALTSNLTTSSTDLPYQNELFSVDRSYTGKVITSASNVYISLGGTNPTLTGIPVTAGSSYYFSYYVKDGSANVTPSITWYDRLGATISTSTGTASAAASTWQKKSMTASAPSNAYFASIKLLFATSGTYYVDMVQFAVDTTDAETYYREARGVDIRLLPTKVNYLQNPSMVNNSDTDWAWTGVGSQSWVTSTLPGIKLDGTNMLQVTPSGTGAWAVSSQTGSGLVNGQYYTFSAYVSTASGTQNISVSASVVDSTGAQISDITGAPATRTSDVVSVGTTWTRLEIPVFMPSTADSTAYLKVSLNGSGTSGAVNIDAAQVEQGYGASDYFDGSYTNRGAYWLGTANNSISVLYRAKSPKINRLVQELPDYIPMNKAFTITSGINGTIVLETSGMSS